MRRSNVQPLSRRLRSRLPLLLALSAAFAAGIVFAPHLESLWPTAHAESAPLVPQAIDIGALKDDDLPASTTPGIRSKGYVVTDQATIGVQVGNAPKHFHSKSDEIQYIVEGTGTAWFGDRQVDIHPGMMIVIPRGTNHGGTVATGGRFKAIAIKIPPQQAGDTTLVN